MAQEPRPSTPYRFAGELCSLTALKLLLCDASLIGWDVTIQMTETRVTLRSTTRAVSFPRTLGADMIWTVGEDWKEE